MDNHVWITGLIYFFFIVLESVLSRLGDRHLYEMKDSLVSVWLGVAGVLMDLAMKTVTFGVLDHMSRHFAFGHIENRYAYWIVLFLAQDLCFYWLHRTEHYSRFLWAVHVTHHSSEKLNFMVALRSSALQPLYRWIFFAPCALLGFGGLDIMFMYALNQTYAFFMHTETVGRLGFIERFMVTPSHHRVHHGCDVPYLDKNMGQVLIIWDKMFGTFAREEMKPTYGLTKNIGSHQPFRVIFHEWTNIVQDMRRPLPLKIRLKYLFLAPGWSHDGSTKTSEQLRKELRLNLREPQDRPLSDKPHLRNYS